MGILRVRAQCALEMWYLGRQLPHAHHAKRRPGPAQSSSAEQLHCYTTVAPVVKHCASLHAMAALQAAAAKPAATAAHQCSISLSRSIACMLGSALVDALGTAVEGHAPGSFPPITEAALLDPDAFHHWPGNPSLPGPGHFTDDTSMALALAHAITETGLGTDQGHLCPKAAVAQLTAFRRWLEKGHWSSVPGKAIDVGRQVRAALTREGWQAAPWLAPPPSSVGEGSNGGIMRAAPLAIALAPVRFAPVAVATHAAACSLTTHSTPACLQAAGLLAHINTALVAGQPRSAVLDDVALPQFLEEWCGAWRHPSEREAGGGPMTPHPRIVAIAGGSYKRRSPPDIAATSNVSHTLEAALWALHQADSFTTGALAVVGLGDDADTAGAVYGSLAGAAFGLQPDAADAIAGMSSRPLDQLVADDEGGGGIPLTWLQALHDAGTVLDSAIALHAWASSAQGPGAWPAASST